MNLEEALREIERLKQIIDEKDKEIEALQKKKNAGRKKKNKLAMANKDTFLNKRCPFFVAFIFVQ